MHGIQLLLLRGGEGIVVEKAKSPLELLGVVAATGREGPYVPHRARRRSADLLQREIALDAQRVVYPHVHLRHCHDGLLSAGEV